MSASQDPRAEHRAFLNRYYGATRRFYDATRKHYLLGRDRAIAQLAREPWTRLVEVGPGTGRNLRKLHRARPDARYGGVDASDAMVDHARARCPWATIVHGYAEQVDFTALLGARPDRILFSYSLSMMTDPEAALANALGQLADGGEVVVVDFGDFAGLPTFVRTRFLAFLAAFRTRPVAPAFWSRAHAHVEWGPGRYYAVARFRA